MHPSYEESFKVEWQGTVQSIQPRTRVWRYVTDNRTHYHLGFNEFLKGQGDHKDKEFCVAISEAQQEKFEFEIGDQIKGTGWTPKYPEREIAHYYRAGALRILEKTNNPQQTSSPWAGLPPELSVYEERGARMLSKSLWEGKCFTCYWAAMANVEIQWDFDRNIKKYRFETFCYGPKSCKHYKMGRARSVPYRNRPAALDDGCLDELCTEGRDFEE